MYCDLKSNLQDDHRFFHFDRAYIYYNTPNVTFSHVHFSALHCIFGTYYTGLYSSRNNSNNKREDDDMISKTRQQRS